MLSLSLLTNSLKAVRDIIITSCASWNIHFRGHLIITPYLVGHPITGNNWIPDLTCSILECKGHLNTPKIVGFLNGIWFLSGIWTFVAPVFRCHLNYSTDEILVKPAMISLQGMVEIGLDDVTKEGPPIQAGKHSFWVHICTTEYRQLVTTWTYANLSWINTLNWTCVLCFNGIQQRFYVFFRTMTRFTQSWNLFQTGLAARRREEIKSV